MNSRWRYGLKVLGRPLWWLSYVVVFGAGAALFTWRDELLSPAQAQHLRLIALLLNWPWYWWALAAAAVLLVILFEGGYRAHRAVGLERDAADAKLCAVSEERPFAFHGGVLATILEPRPGGPILITRIELTFENHGDRMIAYEVTDLFLQPDGGPRAMQALPISRGAHVPARSETAYSFDVSGLVFGRLPAIFEIGFAITYDNAPTPLRRRIMERRVRYTLRSIRPANWENVITHEREV